MFLFIHGFGSNVNKNLEKNIHFVYDKKMDSKSILIGIGATVCVALSASIVVSPPQNTTISNTIDASSIPPPPFNGPILAPDVLFTPGVANQSITQSNIQTTICKKGGYTGGVGPDGKPVRDVTETIKTHVFKEYGVDKNVGGPYEIDHLISLEIGGSNDIENLWPQSYTSSPYNAHMKDALEDHLHSMVCSGQITLIEAQKEISTDWIGAYKKYIVPNN